MGFTVVTTRPASIAPNVAIGNSGTFGKQMAKTSDFFMWNFCWRRSASAALWSRSSANVYFRSVTPQTCKKQNDKSGVSNGIDERQFLQINLLFFCKLRVGSFIFVLCTFPNWNSLCAIGGTVAGVKCGTDHVSPQSIALVNDGREPGWEDGIITSAKFISVRSHLVFPV